MKAGARPRFEVEIGCRLDYARHTSLILYPNTAPVNPSKCPAENIFSASQ
jgi:hypothetical protein